MQNLEIILNDTPATFMPCQEMSGQIKWQLDKNPKYLELSLFWQTHGKGTQDASVVDTLRFDDPGTFGESEFTFTLPNGPYSYSGRLVSIIWSLELSLPKGKDATHKGIVISPTQTEVVCTSLISDSESENNSDLHKAMEDFKNRR